MFRILTFTVTLLYGAVGFSVAQGGDVREKVLFNETAVHTVRNVPSAPTHQLDLLTLEDIRSNPKVPKYARSYKFWSEIGRCETSTEGKTGPQWKRQTNGKKGPSGGLGIALKTWQGYGGTKYAKTAGDATVTQQLIVAYRIGFVGHQTDEFLTWEDRVNNKHFYRPAAGFGQGWGGKCRKHFIYEYKKKHKNKP